MKCIGEGNFSSTRDIYYVYLSIETVGHSLFTFHSTCAVSSSYSFLVVILASLCAPFLFGMHTMCVYVCKKKIVYVRYRTSHFSFHSKRVNETAKDRGTEIETGREIDKHSGVRVNFFWDKVYCPSSKLI